jgi:hypothetical protein
MTQPTYWHRQNLDTPLFEALHWSKPENKASAGKLLIVGGNLHGLNAPGMAFTAAMRAGAGTCHVMLPDAVRKVVGNSFDEGEFAFSTPSGSFAKSSINQIMENAEWCDALLLPGDLGKNSETAILLEKLVAKYSGPLCITQDALDYFIQDVGALTHRTDTLIVTNLKRLQKMTMAGMPSLIIQQSMSLHALVGLLNSWTRETGARILTYHGGSFVYADNGLVSTTSATASPDWETLLSAYATTWWMQQPSKSFEAITTAVYEFAKA